MSHGYLGTRYRLYLRAETWHESQVPGWTVRCDLCVARSHTSVHVHLDFSGPDGKRIFQHKSCTHWVSFQEAVQFTTNFSPRESADKAWSAHNANREPS